MSQRDQNLNHVWDVGTLTWVRMQQPTLEADSVVVTGALTDAELRATPVPVSGTVTATGPLTDTQLRAADVKVTLDGESVAIASLPNEGQQSMANSISVALASDQSTLPVSLSTLPSNVLSTLNSTAANLGAGATFTGTYEDVLAYGSLAILYASDTACTLTLAWSNDGVTAHYSQVVMLARTSGSVQIGVVARYVRLTILNTGGAQSSMSTKTLLCWEGAVSNEVVDVASDTQYNLLKSVPLFAALAYMQNPATGRLHRLKTSDSGENLRVQIYNGTLPWNTISSIDAGASSLVVSPHTFQGATLTNVNDTATSTTLLSGNTARRAATIYNDSTVDLYVKFGITASTTSFTVKIGPQGYYEVPTGYVGRIDGIWASDASGAARITEMTTT
jgi:hypothetical protein